jgi:stearoyl-CoA desaturase (Delta-9 desaturase)
LLPTPTRTPDERIRWLKSLPFLVAQLIPLAAIFTGVTRTSLVIFAVLYFGRMFCITAGYHRYFAHRTYRLARVPQFLLAFGGTTAAQKGPLWWAGHHRDHHRYADTERDPHSPQKGFWWSHVGWILSGKYGSNHGGIDDFARFPELRFLDKHDWIGPWTVGVASFLIGGWSGLVVGFFGSTVLLWHVTFSVNSVTHLVGRRRYGTTDTSRNFVPVALMTLGEGWHNNHHHYPASARQGFYWWEVDPTFAVLRALSWVGVVRDLRKPPETARSARRIRLGHPDVGAFRQHLSRAAATLSRDGLTLPSDDARDLMGGLTDLAERATAAARATRRSASAAPGSVE